MGKQAGGASRQESSKLWPCTLARVLLHRAHHPGQDAKGGAGGSGGMRAASVPQHHFIHLAPVEP